MNRRLNIAVLVRQYDRSGGGAERYCVELTERLAEIHEVHVYAQKVSTESPGITFHTVPRPLKRPRFINQLLFSWYTRRMTSGKYDLVHSHDMVTHANIYTLHVPCIKSRWTEASFPRKIPIALGILSSPRKMAYLWLEWKELRPSQGRHFITVSEYLSRNILKSYPKLEGHITVAHPGINPIDINPEQVKQLRATFRQQHQIPEDAFVLLFVAHGFKRKGLPTLIQALEILNKNKVYLLVAGRGNPTEISFNNNNTRKRTIFLGAIDNMEQLYPVADAFVHPTLGDTFGMAALEAMLFGLPVLISSAKYCGISDYLSNSTNLIIEDPTNPEEITSRIGALVGSSSATKQASTVSKKTADSITWNKTCSQTFHAYSLSNTVMDQTQ